MSQVVRGEVPPEIPDDIDDPGVEKARGVVTLPRRVNWTRTDPTYDLDDRRQRARVYEQVLGEGTAKDVRYFIDVDALIDVWDELVLPPAVSRAWIDWLARNRNARAGLPESDRFVLAGGAALAAHGLLDRTTRDLDYFAAPEDVAAIQQTGRCVRGRRRFARFYRASGA